MKKVIKLASTFVVLVAPNMLYAQTSGQDRFSPAPQVTVGGFVNANAGFRSQEGDFDKERLPNATIVGGVADNTTGSINRMNNNPDFTNEAEVHVKVSGINEFGMKYGAIIELEGNTSTAARNEGFNADKAYIFTESQMGRLEFGNNSAASQRMKVGPETFARGAGGINGKYLEYINLPILADADPSQTAVNRIGNCNGFRVDSAGVVSTSGSDCTNIKLPRFILIPQSPIAHGGYAKGFYNRLDDNSYDTKNAADVFGAVSSTQDNDGQFGSMEDATKVSYYTPRVSGWQLGVSFTPDTGTSGTSASISGDSNGDVKQVVSYGVNFSENFGNVGLALSATGETGQAEQSGTAVIAREDLQAYDIGAMMTFFGITIGASYGDWGDSLQAKSGVYSCNYNPAVAIGSQDCVGANGGNKFDKSTYQTAGIAYQFGPFASSLTYIESSFQNNDYNAISFGVDYRMAKGLMPYIEVTKYQFESNQVRASDVTNQTGSSVQLKDNEGYVALAGLLFSF